MGKLVTWEFQYFLQCFIWGVWMMILYDMLRIFRLVLYHKTLWIAIEDILYWIYCAIGMFVVMYMWNDGNIRWFSIAGAGMGMILYNVLVSRYTVPIIGKAIYKLIQFLFAPIIFIYKKMKSVTKFLVKRVKILRFTLIKMLKKLCKSVNIIGSKENGKESEKFR